MKKYLHLALLLLFSYTTYSQVWQLLSIPKIESNYYFMDVEVVDKNVVWILATSYANNPNGSTPIILKTNDGGLTWQKRIVQLASSRVSYDIFAFDSLTAIITSNKLVNSDTRPIYKTTNGGFNWKAITPPSRSGGDNIHFFNQDEGLVINGKNASISEDKGETWSLTSDNLLNENEYLTFIGGKTNSHFSIGDDFWIGTATGKIIKSKDKGKTWKVIQAAKTSEWIIKIIFIDSLNGFFSVNGENNNHYAIPVLYHTNDGGSSWVKSSIQNSNFHSIGINPLTNTIYAGNELIPFIFKLNNDFFNDETWELCFDEAILIYGVRFSNNVGYAIGRDENDNNIVLKLNSEPNTSNETSEKTNAQIYPNPTLGLINIKSDLTIKKIVIRDNIGQILMTDEINNDEYDISRFSAGYYHILIKSDKQIINEKVLKI